MDACDEGGGVVVVVLAACVGEEGEFCDAGADVLACGSTGCEACISHGWACFRGEKN